MVLRGGCLLVVVCTAVRWLIPGGPIVLGGCLTEHDSIVLKHSLKNCRVCVGEKRGALCVVFSL